MYVPLLNVNTVPPAPALATIDDGMLLNTSKSIVKAVPGETELFGVCVICINSA